MSTTARYAGLWNGGTNYVESGVFDAELFDSIADAADAIRDRRDLGHWYPQTFRYVFRDASSDLTPCAHNDSTGGIDLYRIDGMDVADPIDNRWIMDTIAQGIPDARLTIGPRGGIRRD